MSDSLYLVAGLGKTGHSIARYLRRRNKPFVLFDTRKDPAGLLEFQVEFPDVAVFLSNVPETLLSSLVAIIASPGVDLSDPFMQKAASKGVPIYGDIECLAREVTVPIIAITGTNGKSTVTTLVGEIASAAGFSVAVAGNIGAPVLDLLDDTTDYDLWVLELSSFQLDLTTSLAPFVATILNITPDHLDRHHTFEAYVAAKHRIYSHAKFILYNREDALTRPEESSDDTRLQVTNFGLDVGSEGNWGIIGPTGNLALACGKTEILSVDALRIKGRHNWMNAMAACALVMPLGISTICIKEVLQRFGGLPHRSQWLKTIDGVDWINDSKGTNIGATLSAISGIGGSMQGRIVLIAGGQGKGADFSELAKPMSDYVRTVILIGVDAEKIEQAIGSVVYVKRASSLDDAVAIAKLEAHAGDVVLLSPACASLDMFRDFNHRGEVFAKAVDAL